MDYSLLRREEFAAHQLGELPEWDIFLSAYNKSTRVNAVFEAVKGLAQRIRDLSGLGSDGGELITEAFSVKSPIIAFNSLQTETERSEQKGIANLMIGLFGAIRNPTAHAPKITWAMPEQDAIDVFALVSFIHRKLDNAVKL